MPIGVGHNKAIKLLKKTNIGLGTKEKILIVILESLDSHFVTALKKKYIFFV